MRTPVIIVLSAGILVLAGIFVAPQDADAPRPLPTSADASDTRTQLQAVAFSALQDLFDASVPSLSAPVAEFRSRATLKQFGTYITPDTSPVVNDRFTGFHTGIDAEFTDTDEDIPVVAIADGTVVYSGWVKGYGGVVVLRHVVEDVALLAVYGHVDPASIISTRHVAAGEQIAVLGDGETDETDGVRKHLHFSIRADDVLDLRGYVQSESELNGWLNPLDLIQ